MYLSERNEVDQVTQGLMVPPVPPMPPIDEILYGGDGPDRGVTLWLTPRSHAALQAATARHPELTVIDDGDSVANRLMSLAYTAYVAHDIAGELLLQDASGAGALVPRKLMVGDQVLTAEGGAEWSQEASGAPERQQLLQGRSRNVLTHLTVRRTTYGQAEQLAAKYSDTLTDVINRMLKEGEWIDAHLLAEGQILIPTGDKGALTPIAFDV